MLRTAISGLGMLAIIATATVLHAQQVEESASIVSRDVASQVSAFSYVEGPESKLTLRGTPLTPVSEGKVQVEFQQGRSDIKAEVEKMPDPWSVGSYTTYVLWAITPDGRATNLGVIETSEGRGRLETSFSGSQFALIVNAEPHFAVSAPSKAVVLLNVAERVKGTETRITSLAERADYSSLPQIGVDKKTAPLDLVAARYAVAIAAAAGAEQYAAAPYTEAAAKLQAAEAAQSSKKSSDRRMVPKLSREAVQAGEDARRAGMAGKSAAEAEQRRLASASAAATAATTEERARSEVMAAESAQMAAESAQEALRARLAEVLPTRVTERGVVSELGGVQFATGTARLTSGARESLAKFAGVVASYPSLRYVIEGHTDSTGSDATNRELSLKRAITVRDYLIGQGIAASATDAQGMGPDVPIGDNGTVDGRARNRRVEIIVAGTALASNAATAVPR